MGTKYSAQLTAVTPPSYAPLKPNECGGRVRCQYFNYVAASAVDTDVIHLCSVPSGARIIGGRIMTDGLGTSCTLSVGTLASAALLLGATAMASAAQADLANTYALGFGTELTADTVITATLGGANATDGKIIKGWIEYVVD